jgi:ferredoxin-nitrate reductase
VAHAAVDPTSKQPELKAMAVRVERVRGEAVARRERAAARLVVVGTGMAALAVVEELLRHDPRWAVTMLGEERGPVYNRMLLSKLLAGDVGEGDLELRPRAWYAQRSIDLRDDCGVVAVDTAARTVTDERGNEHRYDALVIATGSRAVVPPVAGADLPHVHVFRTRTDVAALGGGRRAVVLGGGLLGLEAAAGLRARGQQVAVVEAALRLMGRQLDDAAAAMLAAEITRRRIALHLGRTASQITPEAVLLDDGTALAADTVVVAAGVRPETELAGAAGLPIGRGVHVDDAMRAGARRVWAVGECAEHRGTVYGLWAPLAEQARVAGAAIAGDPAAFHGVVSATTLKVAGVDLYAGGRADALDGDDEVVLRDTRRGVYRKLVVRGERLVGALLLGDLADARRCSSALRGEIEADALLAAPGPAEATIEPDTVVCSCNHVTAGAIDDAIRARGLTTLPQVANATRATTGCGSCAAEVGELLARHSSSARNTRDQDAKSPHATIGA